MKVAFDTPEITSLINSITYETPEAKTLTSNVYDDQLSLGEADDNLVDDEELLVLGQQEAEVMIEEMVREQEADMAEPFYLKQN